MTFALTTLESAHRRAALSAQRQLLRELPYLRLSYDAGNSWLYADWIGEQTSTTMQEGAELILAEVAAAGHTKLLNDNTHLTHMSVTEQGWRSLHMLPHLFQVGLRYMAWVYSPDPRGRLYADFSVAQTNWPFLLTFEEYNVAAEWLRQY